MDARQQKCKSETEGLKHCFFILAVQIFMSGFDLWTEPLKLAVSSKSRVKRIWAIHHRGPEP